MDINLLDNLSETTRYKIYILNNRNLDLAKTFSRNSDLKIINLGKEISSKLITLNKSTHFDLFILDIAQSIIEQNIRQGPESPHKIVVIENLGILLEPTFKINVERFLAEISKNVHLLILWSGQINQQGLLSWTLKKDLFNLDFTEYSPKLINYPNEI